MCLAGRLANMSQSDTEMQSEVDSSDDVTTQPAVAPAALAPQPEKDSQPRGKVLSKKRKRACKWQSDWTRYNMKKSKRGESFAHCNVCNSEVSVASAGSY